MIIINKPEQHSIFKEIGLNFLNNSIEIEAWFRNQSHKTQVPFYSSIDIRNAGFKFAPIDTNLFPGGFNNISLNDNSYTIAIQSALEKICPLAKTLCLIPENHTRNEFYLQNIATLITMLKQAGFSVLIGSLRKDLIEKEQIMVNGEFLTFHPLKKDENNKIIVDGKTPCALLLNNDLSAGVPDILKDIDAQQKIIPHVNMGWHSRLKSHHYNAYHKVVVDFCTKFKLDPWLISTLFTTDTNVDFSSQTSMLSVTDKATELFTKIEQKYKQFNIKEQPFIIVKAESGTYGMGVISITEPEQLIKLNRKQRKKMSVIKDGVLLDKILIQEGVPTIESWEHSNNIAEPVLYLIDRYVIGGFYRFHPKKTPTDSLNSPGMIFAPMPFTMPCQQPNWGNDLDDEHNKLYAYSIVARLASLASSYETH